MLFLNHFNFFCIYPAPRITKNYRPGFNFIAFVYRFLLDLRNCWTYLPINIPVYIKALYDIGLISFMTFPQNIKKINLKNYLLENTYSVRLLFLFLSFPNVNSWNKQKPYIYIFTFILYCMFYSLVSRTSKIWKLFQTSHSVALRLETCNIVASVYVSAKT